MVFEPMSEEQIRAKIATAVDAKVRAEAYGQLHMNEAYTKLIRDLRDAIDLMYKHGYAIDPETLSED